MRFSDSVADDTLASNSERILDVMLVSFVNAEPTRAAHSDGRLD
jgi:hypothetical protein